MATVPLDMALQTREQHIRRQSATSNICTAQVLLAIMAGMYGVYHGPDGIKGIASRIHSQASVFETAVKSMGYEQLNESYFDTLYIKAPNATQLKQLCEANEVNLRFFDNDCVGVAFDETKTVEDLQQLVDIFAEAAGKSTVKVKSSMATSRISKSLERNSNYMFHPVFNSYQSEHEMLRYIKRLESKDLSLCHSMISLGSCTMKLNATAEMIPVTWPEFNGIHPFAPQNQVVGYNEILSDLENDLAVITGFHGTSLQPNAGAQGEYTGLLTIKAYLEDKGEGHRHIALIPSSAHGTNPASAVMAGMKVVVTKCDEKGNIDVTDLKEKAELHKDNLACLMVTYPSTHGVFETAIKEITQLIHDNGGQVYIGWCKHECPSGLNQSRYDWCRCMSLELAQNILYTAWWWWTRNGTYLRCRAFNAILTEPRNRSCFGREGNYCCFCSTIWKCQYPIDILCIY